MTENIGLSTVHKRVFQQILKQNKNILINENIFILSPAYITKKYIGKSIYSIEAPKILFQFSPS